MKILRRLAVSILSGLSLILFAGCATVGETGRHQLMLISAEEEMQLGLAAFQEMKQTIRINTDGAANAMLQTVGQRIAAVADLPGAQWEFVLFDSPEANAFCLPGGKVGVYTGILPITQTEAGLATVIGHEVAHAYAHHGGERMTQAMIAQYGSQAVGQMTASQDPETQAMWNSLYGMGVQVAALLPYSRLQESEADRIGLRYMARAGYDPEEAVLFWERFGAAHKQEGSSPTAFLDRFFRTHPLDETRIKQLKQWMPEAKAQYRQAQP